MKFISWNVNGLRACTGKGFLDFFHAIDADIFCLQETKLQEGQISLDFATSSGVPSAITVPPQSPSSGPISMI